MPVEKIAGPGVDIALVFPHQLFEKSPLLNGCSDFVLVEEPLFFSQFRFHKQKLVYHRATMKAYQQFLLGKGKSVRYVEFHEPLAHLDLLFKSLADSGEINLHVIEVTDKWLEKKITRSARTHQIRLATYPSPLFLNSMAEINAFFDQKKHFHQTDFYKIQRQKRSILLEPDGKPLGGKWTYDAENRLRYPKNQKPPLLSFPKPDDFVREAVAYVQKHFSHHYGDLDSEVFYPWNFHLAKEWLEQFLENRFAAFGEYEDAMLVHQHFLHHSVLTPMLNVGLLTPAYVLERTLDVASKNNIPLNSCEGFIRQIMGWREFIRGVYEKKGSFQRTRNFWGFQRKLPQSFWEGTTGILPVDSCINHLKSTAYNHHIERLMVLGNFMLLCEIHPDSVYEWFMTMYIDAYDWVMVPNVYGMSQFADGGLMSTKPYLSGSAYILKMSDLPKGPWTTIWDALFWRFLHVNRDFFLKNPRLGMLIRTFDKMEPGKRNGHLNTADDFLRKLDLETE